MGLGVGVFLLALGAILTFAVHASVSGLDLAVVGLVLMGAGLLGVVLELRCCSRRAAAWHTYSGRWSPPPSCGATSSDGRPLRELRARRRARSTRSRGAFLSGCQVPARRATGWRPTSSHDCHLVEPRPARRPASALVAGLGPDTEISRRTVPPPGGTRRRRHRLRASVARAPGAPPRCRGAVLLKPPGTATPADLPDLRRPVDGGRGGRGRRGGRGAAGACRGAVRAMAGAPPRWHGAGCCWARRPDGCGASADGDPPSVAGRLRVGRPGGTGWPAAASSGRPRWPRSWCSPRRAEPAGVAVRLRRSPGVRRAAADSAASRAVSRWTRRLSFRVAVRRVAVQTGGFGGHDGTDRAAARQAFLDCLQKHGVDTSTLPPRGSAPARPQRPHHGLGVAGLRSLLPQRGCGDRCRQGGRGGWTRNGGRIRRPPPGRSVTGRGDR